MQFGSSLRKAHKFVIALAVQGAIIFGLITAHLVFGGFGTPVLLEISPVEPSWSNHLQFSFAQEKIYFYPFENRNYAGVPQVGETIYVMLTKSGKYWNNSGVVKANLPNPQEEKDLDAQYWGEHVFIQAKVEAVEDGVNQYDHAPVSVDGDGFKSAPPPYSESKIITVKFNVSHDYQGRRENIARESGKSKGTYSALILVNEDGSASLNKVMEGRDR